MPADFPHWRTIYEYASGWQKSGATEDMHDELRRQCRIAAGCDLEPTAAIIDSQSVRAAETVGKGSRGYDAGKKINGRKPHIAVDTIGLLLTVLITTAGVEDRDGAKPLLWNLRKHSPRSGSPGPTAGMPASSSPGPRCRRTVRDRERLSGHHETMVHWAMTITMTRRLADRQPAVQSSATSAFQATFARSTMRRGRPS
jgi:putative transposase